MIRAFDNQSYEEKRTNKSFADYANQMIKVNRIFAWVTPIAFLLMGIVYADTCLLDDRSYGIGHYP